MAIDIGWTGIVSGTDNGDAVEAKLTSTFQNIENELNTLHDNALHQRILHAVSTTDQAPAGLGVGNAIKVTFGGAQDTANVSVDALGNVTFHTAGAYRVRFLAHYGRAGSTGASMLAFRLMLNDVQVDNPQVAKIDNADILQAWADVYVINVNASDVFYGELMRVDGFDNSGGLYATDTGVGGWGIAPSAELHIYKVG